MKERFELNIDKFELYSRRNVLSNKVINNQSQLSPSKKSKTDAKTVNTTQSVKLEQLKALRQSYLDLQQKYKDSMLRKAELESLQEEINKVVFSVRVAKQAFEDESLEKSVAIIHERSKQLESLNQRAYCKCIHNRFHQTSSLLCELVINDVVVDIADKIEEIRHHESDNAETGLVVPTAQRHQHITSISMPVALGSDTTNLTSSIRQRNL